MQEERSAKLMNYLNRPLDDVAQIERQNDRWNIDSQSNVTKKSEQKSNRDSRNDGIQRIILRDVPGGNSYYNSGYRAPGGYRGYSGPYPGMNRKFWVGRYSNSYRGGRGFDRKRDFDRGRDFDRRGEYERGRNYYYRGMRNYYRGRKYYPGGYYYINNYNKRPYEPIPIKKKVILNDAAVLNGYRRPLIKDSTRRIIKDVAVPNIIPRSTVVATGLNRYNIIPPVGINRFNNLNISLYRNRKPVFPITGRGRVIPKPGPISLRRGNIAKPRLRMGLNKPIKRNPDHLKGESKIDTYLMSKIKIYTSPENIPPPFTQQLDADVNLPRSLQRRSNQKKED